MPAFILPWLAGAAGVALVTWLVKAASEDSGSSSNGRSSADVERDNEQRRRDALRAQYRARMDSLARAVLAEHGIKVSEAERKRFVELALDDEDEEPLNAFVGTLVPRATEIREHDEQIAAAEAEVATMQSLAAPLRILAGRAA